ncbi:hypothetical protein GCM10027053_48130 [Intrasporangium mesophilum]
MSRRARAWAPFTLRRGVVAGPVALVVLAVLMMLGCLCLVASASVSRSVAQDYVARGTLGQVEVTEPVDAQEVRYLTRDATAGFARLPGVTGVAVRYRCSLPWGERAAILAGTTWSPIDKVTLVAGRAVQRNGEIVLPERVQGMSARERLGSTITIDAVSRVAQGQGRTTEEAFRVVGIYSLAHAPERPDTAYLSRADALRLAAAREGLAPEDFDRTRGADSIVLQTASTETARAVAEQLRGQHFDARATADRVADVSGAPGLVRMAGSVLAVAAGLVVALSVAMRAGEAGTRRLRELALLRGLGWTVGDLRSLLVIESALVTVVSVVLGYAAGLPLSVVVVRPLLDLLGLSGGVTVPVALLTAVAAALVLTTSVATLLAVRRSLAKDPYLVARSQV